MKIETNTEMNDKNDKNPKTTWINNNFTSYTSKKSRIYESKNNNGEPAIIPRKEEYMQNKKWANDETVRMILFLFA